MCLLNKYSPKTSVAILSLLLLNAVHVQFAMGQNSAPADAWTQFRGTENLSGISASSIPDNPQLLWSYEASESIDSSAAIANGTVFVGTYAGELVALDLEDGTVKWTYQASDRMGIGESSPAVGHNLVFIGDLAGVLHAVDINTGEAAWTYVTQGEIKSSPVLSGEHVLIGSYDGFLYGLTAETGQLQWKLETQNYVHATPAVFDGITATQPRTPADKPLFLHALAMREYLEAGWVDRLYWFDTLAMLADGLTKGAVDREALALKTALKSLVSQPVPILPPHRSLKTDVRTLGRSTTRYLDWIFRRMTSSGVTNTLTGTFPFTRPHSRLMVRS